MARYCPVEESHVCYPVCQECDCTSCQTLGYVDMYHVNDHDIFLHSFLTLDPAMQYATAMHANNITKVRHFRDRHNQFLSYAWKEEGYDAETNHSSMD